MRLPVMPPANPMLATLAREIPDVAGAIYEPKWDGFRTVVFRDGDEIELGSRGEKSMTRYFPEMIEPLKAALPDRCVVDGELVVAGKKGLDFNVLQQRIHPADSRVQLLAQETPATYVAFDLIALGDRDLRPEPFAERRRLLEESLDLAAGAGQILVTPATTTRSVAQEWLDRFQGGGLDGVIMKQPDQPYAEGKRVMVKVKHEHTAECVVAGLRRHKHSGIGSMLLGLFDGNGTLHHVGVCSAFSAKFREDLVPILEPYLMPTYEGHPWASWTDEAAHEKRLMPGTPSRWSGGKESMWEPVRQELVAEVRYEHLQGARFRHPARFVRWRPDRDPESCTYGQLVVPVPAELDALF